MSVRDPSALRIDHVSIAVRDVEAALAFFRQCLPIEMRHTPRPGYIDDFKWCDFSVGGFTVELIEPGRPDSFVSRFLDRRGEGLHHLSIEVRDLDPLVTRLEADGIRVVGRFRAADGDQTAFISPRSAQGVLIQFWQDPTMSDT